jgi:hypothetical protein
VVRGYHLGIGGVLETYVEVWREENHTATTLSA